MNCPYKMHGVQKHPKSVSQPMYASVPENKVAHYVDVGDFTQKTVDEKHAGFMHFRGFGFWTSCASNFNIKNKDPTYDELSFYMRKDYSDPCGKAKLNHTNQHFEYFPSMIDFNKEKELMKPYNSYPKPP
eukprot:UN24073